VRAGECGALAGGEQPVEDLALGRLGELLDELDAADAGAGRYLVGHPCDQLAWRGGTARHDNRLGHLAEALVGTRDDGRLSDRRMGLEDIFEDAEHTHRFLTFRFGLTAVRADRIAGH
jgi:hypothetical protein